MEDRTRLRAYLRRRRLDAILITDPCNRRYLSGYTAPDHSVQESSGVLFITRDGSRYLLTDFRYQTQAREEAVGWQVVIHSGPLFDSLLPLLERHRVRRLGFEENYFLFRTYRRLRDKSRALDLEMIPVHGLIERRRAVKDHQEIEKIQRSVALNEAVFQAVLPRITPGRTETEVAADIEATMRAMGAAGPSFETIVASGPNGALPHAVPGSRRLRESEPIVIDMGLVLDGYCSDMTRTIVLGPVPPDWRRIFQIVRRAQAAATAALAPGKTCCEVDAVARDLIRDAGYGQQFGHALGHGVGLAVHEAPRLSRFSRAKLHPGMVVTIEPGIYLEGKGGVRLENMAVVTDNGCDILNKDTTFLDL